jgi:hypothetical protein
MKTYSEGVNDSSINSGNGSTFSHNRQFENNINNNNSRNENDNFNEYNTANLTPTKQPGGKFRIGPTFPFSRSDGNSPSQGLTASLLTSDSATNPSSPGTIFISPVRAPDRSIIQEPNDIFSPSSTQIRRQLRQKSSNSPQIQLEDVVEYKHSASELKQAGCTCADLKSNGLTAVQLIAIGYSLSELRLAGFTIQDMANDG